MCKEERESKYEGMRGRSSAGNEIGPRKEYIYIYIVKVGVFMEKQKFRIIKACMSVYEVYCVVLTHIKIFHCHEHNMAISLVEKDVNWFKANKEPKVKEL